MKNILSDILDTHRDMHRASQESKAIAQEAHRIARRAGWDRFDRHLYRYFADDPWLYREVMALVKYETPDAPETNGGGHLPIGDWIAVLKRNGWDIGVGY